MTSEAVYVLGHSWGADLSLHIGATFPDRIKGLTLIDGGYVFPEMVVGYSEEQALSDWAEYFDGGRYSSWEKVVDTYKAYTTRQWDHLLEKMISSNFVKVDGFYQLKADRDSLLATIKAFYLEPCSTTYPSIECPALLFHATIPHDDPSRQKGIEKLQEEVKGVKIVGIENTQHNVHWDCPEQVGEVIREWIIMG
ncbi:alpha/beta fold hydrolase [Bacillus sp. KH172YL63]|uniref:alpha/beta fold hydrolase n=1 Tax=Bacillus sp. KH172YL63 TaxID=2709784 RepID=UPI0013E4C92A|nr:alpha/beta hydrolase [Bacillus sp. KH172YL63]BCB05120.1 hypothetical protein KH172YL63_32530 [Bacillus sp. KH172YL63]